jgi:pimeloyl-ACP methyl ester carboxylesterase
LQDHGEWTRMAHNTYRPGDDGMLHFDWDVDLVKPLQRMREIPDLWPLFRGIGRIPAVAIRGALSDVLSEETFARMQVEKPDLARVTIPGVGHAPTLNEAEAVAAIDLFLARLDAA